MKSFLLPFLLCSILIAQNPHRPRVLPGQPLQLSYSDIRLKAGDTSVTLISQHGTRMILPGVITESNLQQFLTFTLPTGFVRDEWKVYFVMVGGKKVQLDTYFDVGAL